MINSSRRVTDPAVTQYRDAFVRTLMQQHGIAKTRDRGNKTRAMSRDQLRDAKHPQGPRRRQR